MTVDADESAGGTENQPHAEPYRKAVETANRTEGAAQNDGEIVEIIKSKQETGGEKDRIASCADSTSFCTSTYNHTPRRIHHQPAYELFKAAKLPAVQKMQFSTTQ